MTPRQERIGLLSAALCALNGAFVPAVAKLTTNNADPLFVATLTTLFGALAAFSILALRGRLAEIVAPRHLPSLFAIGTLGTGVAFILFYGGASRTSAIEAVLCLQIEPAYSLLLAWLALGHRPTRRRLIATALLLLGITLAIGARGIAPSSGVWLLLLTPLAWQLSHLIVLRRLVGVTSEILTAARYIFGGAVLVLVWLASGAAVMPLASCVAGEVCSATAMGYRQIAAALPLIALQGVLLSYVGTLFWYGAVTRLDLARATSIVVPSVPLLSIAASFILLGEVPTAAQWCGLALTAIGVFSFVTAPHAVAASRTPLTEAQSVAAGG